MSYLARNIIYKNDIAYKIIDIIKVHNFQNKDGSINKQVLGMYVHYKGADHVLQQDNMFLICETIEEAQIIN
jgi:hypothetical protein